MRRLFNRCNGFSSKRFLLSMNAQLFELLQSIGNDVSLTFSVCSQRLLDTWVETDNTMAVYLQQVEKYDAMAS